MKKISYWARGHRSMARILLAALQLLMVLLAFFTGRTLWDNHFTLHWSFLAVSAVILLAAIAAYPRRCRYKGSSTTRYFRQKSCDFLVALCCFCLLCFMADRDYRPALFPTSVYSSQHVVESKPPHHHRHILLKILTILGVVVFAVACFYGIAALSCGLSCSGSTGAAIFVLIAGLAGIITLSIFGIKAILRWGRRNRSSIRREYTPGTITLR